MKRFINKRILKKIIHEIIKYIIISLSIYGCIFAFYQLSCISPSAVGKYAKTHSEVSSDNFLRFRIDNHNNYEFLVSEEKNTNNELWIFEKNNNSLYSFLHLSGRYKRTPYLHATSEKSISSVCFDLFTNGGGIDVKDTVLLYYSNNKDNISLCKYTVKNDNGYIEEIEQTINPYQPFIVFIPYTKFYRNWEYEIYDVLFYNLEGNLVFSESHNNK